jgi:hypothetical protein
MLFRVAWAEVDAAMETGQQELVVLQLGDRHAPRRLGIPTARLLREVSMPVTRFRTTRFRSLTAKSSLQFIGSAFLPADSESDSNPAGACTQRLWMHSDAQ